MVKKKSICLSFHLMYQLSEINSQWIYIYIYIYIYTSIDFSLMNVIQLWRYLRIIPNIEVKVLFFFFHKNVIQSEEQFWKVNEYFNISIFSI